jgi:hypothetical protein
MVIHEFEVENKIGLIHCRRSQPRRGEVGGVSCAHRTLEIASWLADNFLLAFRKVRRIFGVHLLRHCKRISNSIHRVSLLRQCPLIRQRCLGLPFAITRMRENQRMHPNMAFSSQAKPTEPIGKQAKRGIKGQRQQNKDSKP